MPSVSVEQTRGTPAHLSLSETTSPSVCLRHSDSGVCRVSGVYLLVEVPPPAHLSLSVRLVDVRPTSCIRRPERSVWLRRGISEELRCSHVSGGPSFFSCSPLLAAQFFPPRSLAQPKAAALLRRLCIALLVTLSGLS
jgi:hypothetical protein